MCTVQEFMDAYIGPNFKKIYFFSSNDDLSSISPLPVVDRPLDLYGARKVKCFSISSEHELRLWIK